MKSQLKVAGLLLLSLAMLQPAFAQKSDASKGKHLPLWKIDGITNQVYLMGSVHFLFETNYPLAKPMESAASGADVLVFEVNPGVMMQLDKQMEMMKKGQLAEGEDLKDLLTPGTYKKVQDYFKEAEMPSEMFMRFKPGFLAVTITSLEVMKMGMNPQDGIDLHFYTAGKEAGKKIDQLETLEMQTEMLTGMSKEDGEAFLKTTLKQVAEEKDKIGELLKVWQTGDASGLDKYMNDAMKEIPGVQKRLVNDRNEKWIPQIEQFIKSGKNVTIIVGAAHLVGDKGVVELLKKKGVKITQQ